MKIVALAENSTERAGLDTVHGLSIHIKTEKHKLLFDLGPDETCFRNAERLGIDLAEVDTVVISHGHYDHGGALAEFLGVNAIAKIYIRRQAFEPHFASVKGERLFIGLNPDLAENERIVFAEDAMRIDGELFLFSGADGVFDTQSGRALLKKAPDGYVQDDFDHEQNLIVTTEGVAVLFSGCSHSGIAGILSAGEQYQPDIGTVFGGFHMYNPNTGVTEPAETVRELAEKLASYDSVFYTCHCTGAEAFGQMSEIMGEKLRRFSTGSVIEL